MSRSNLDERRLERRMTGLLATEPETPQRRTAAGRVLDELARSGALTAWARAASPPAGTSGLIDTDEIAQIIAEDILDRLGRITAAEAERVRRWSGWCWWKARQAVRDRLETGAYTVASGMATVLRRYARVTAAQEAAFRELGRTPTIEETIAVANAGREERARRDGTLVTAADFRYTHLGRSIDDAPIGVQDEDGRLDGTLLPEQPDHAEDVASRLAADFIAASLLDAVRTRVSDDPDLAAVGAAWLSAVVDGEPVPTARGCARANGWSQQRARAAVVGWAEAVARLRDEGLLDDLIG